ncbi:hypothetical protein ACQKGC_21745 [Allorhizobium pseudoryzae]|jgi:hypothetical protein
MPAGTLDMLRNYVSCAIGILAGDAGDTLTMLANDAALTAE